MAFSHLATTSVATQLPTMLVNTNIAERMRWMPSTSAMLLTGMVLVADSVKANTAIADPDTPAPPLDVSSSTNSRPSCACQPRSVPVACPRNTLTAAKYRQVPSWLKL